MTRRHASGSAIPTDAVWITRAQLADRIGYSEKTLRNWASEGRGPKFGKFGNRVRYRLKDIEEWEPPTDQQLAA